MTKECTMEEFIASTPGMRESIEYANAKFRDQVKRDKRNQARRERDQAMRDIGMVKVRGALGGVYWE